MNELKITEMDGYKEKYAKTVKKNTENKIKIPASEAKPKKISKKVLALLLAGTVGISSVGITCFFGKRRIVDDMLNEGCVDLDVNSRSYDSGTKLFSQDSTNRDKSIDIEKYISSVINDSKEKGFSSDEIYITISDRYGIDIDQYDFDEFKESTVISRFSTKFEAGKEEILNMLSEKNESKGSR